MRLNDHDTIDHDTKHGTIRLGVLLKRLRLCWRTYKTLKAQGRWMPEIRINARVVFIELSDVEAWKAAEKARVAATRPPVASPVPAVTPLATPPDTPAVSAPASPSPAPVEATAQDAAPEHPAEAPPAPPSKKPNPVEWGYGQ